MFYVRLLKQVGIGAGRVSLFTVNGDLEPLGLSGNQFPSFPRNRCYIKQEFSPSQKTTKIVAHIFTNLDEILYEITSKIIKKLKYIYFKNYGIYLISLVSRIYCKTPTPFQRVRVKIQPIRSSMLACPVVSRNYDLFNDPFAIQRLIGGCQCDISPFIYSRPRISFVTTS